MKLFVKYYGDTLAQLGIVSLTCVWFIPEQEIVYFYLVLALIGLPFGFIKYYYRDR